MSRDPLPFPVVGLVGDGATQTPLLEALRVSGRDLRWVDPAVGPSAELDLLLVPATTGADVPVDALTAAMSGLGARVPVVIEAETVSATELAARLPDPGRVLVIHHFDTGPGRQVVEVVPAVQTHEEFLQAVVDLVNGLDDLAAVVTKDRPGYLLNSLFLPYLNDAIRELDDGLATADDIDVALRLGLGYKAGPFELLDEMGLDRHLATTSWVHEATGDHRFAPPVLLSRLTTAGLAFHNHPTPHASGDMA